MAEIGALPKDQQPDALLQYFMDVLRTMPLETLRARRGQFIAHFADCGCSYETCVELIALVDQVLASRRRQPKRPKVARAFQRVV